MSFFLFPAFETMQIKFQFKQSRWIYTMSYEIWCSIDLFHATPGKHLKTFDILILLGVIERD